MGAEESRTHDATTLIVDADSDAVRHDGRQTVTHWHPGPGGRCPLAFALLPSHLQLLFAPWWDCSFSLRYHFFAIWLHYTAILSRNVFTWLEASYLGQVSRLNILHFTTHNYFQMSYIWDGHAPFLLMQQDLMVQYDNLHDSYFKICGSTFVK